MKQARIDALSTMIGETVELRGWLYNRRGNKNLHFLQVRDGSGFVQAVMNRAEVGDESFDRIGSIGIESSIIVRGKVAADTRSPIGVELQGVSVDVIQAVQDYPIQITKDVPNVEKLLDIRHLWIRSPKARAVLKIRSELIQAIRQFYYERGFVCFDSPIFTPNACEGTSTLFETDYFGNPMFLSQSGQLYGEAGAMAFGKVVVFGPTFRAEKSKTRRHLTEFWMCEPEVAFIDLDGIMDLAEEKLEYLVQWVLRTCRTELATLERDVAKLEAIRRPFPRISYSDAQKVLVEKKAEFAASDDKELRKLANDMLQKGLGDDLGAADETAISMQYDRPVMIHRYPAAVKAFYMKKDPVDPTYALCVDVIAPDGFGEIIGGAMREEDYEVLVKAIETHGLPMESFDWFLDLRKYGTVPHGGFGLGLERVTQWLTGSHHIREAIPFPRTMVRMRP